MNFITPSNHLALQNRLNYIFKQPQLLQRALTHRSFSVDHNERLEFLGDSVLGLAVSDLLYRQLHHLPEGDLSRVRASLVRQEMLHQLALDLNLPPCLSLGEGEFRSGGQKRPSILADALEAILGAVYLDGGFVAVQVLVHRLYRSIDINPAMVAKSKDSKTELQEWLQARKLSVPRYKVVCTQGAAHQQTFDVSCEISELHLCERSMGQSRRSGEQAAATAMLQTLKTKGTP